MFCGQVRDRAPRSTRCDWVRWGVLPCFNATRSQGWGPGSGIELVSAEGACRVEGEPPSRDRFAKSIHRTVVDVIIRHCFFKIGVCKSIFDVLQINFFIRLNELETCQSMCRFVPPLKISSRDNRLGNGVARLKSDVVSLDST